MSGIFSGEYAPYTRTAAIGRLQNIFSRIKMVTIFANEYAQFDRKSGKGMLRNNDSLIPDLSYLSSLTDKTLDTINTFQKVITAPSLDVTSPSVNLKKEKHVDNTPGDILTLTDSDHECIRGIIESVRNEKLNKKNIK